MLTLRAITQPEEGRAVEWCGAVWRRRKRTHDVPSVASKQERWGDEAKGCHQKRMVLSIKQIDERAIIGKVLYNSFNRGTLFEVGQ